MLLKFAKVIAFAAPCGLPVAPDRGGARGAVAPHFFLVGAKIISSPHFSGQFS